LAELRPAGTRAAELRRELPPLLARAAADDRAVASRRAQHVLPRLARHQSVLVLVLGRSLDESHLEPRTPRPRSGVVPPAPGLAHDVHLGAERRRAIAREGRGERVSLEDA